MKYDDLVEARFHTQQKVMSKRMKCCSYSSLCFGVGLIVLGCLIPIIVGHVIEGKIREKVVMSKGNIQLWGELPGESQINVYRNVTFYEFTNSIDVVFRGQKPVFKERKGFNYYMRQKFLNSSFQNGEVSYNRYTYYEKIIDNQNDVNVTTKITTVNPGALGIWNVIKTMDAPTLALISSGALIENVQVQVSLNIYYQGLNYNLLSDYSKAKPVFSGIPDEQKRQILWNDTYYGLSSQNTMENWIRAANEGDDFGVSSGILKDYFQLSQDQITGINQKMRTLIYALNQTAYKYYGCNVEGSTSQKYDCDGHYFASLQFSSSGVSNDPPPGMGIPSHDSIVYINDTLHDFPEFNYFYTKDFLVNIDNSTQYQNLTFGLDWVHHFLERNFDFPNSQPLQDESILQHRGNMLYIYEIGIKYDKSQDLTQFNEFMVRFRLPTVQHSRIIWEWVKQIESKFAKRIQLQGNTQGSGMAKFVTQQLYWSFQNLTEYLLPTLISKMVLDKQDWVDCQQMVQVSIYDITDEQYLSICSLKEFTLITQDTVKFILDICDKQYSNKWQEFKMKSHLNSFQMVQMCDEGSTEKSFQTLINGSHIELKDKYACRFERCSRVELALKQWSRSEISLNPPNGFISNTSVHFWNDELFKKPFEYGHFRVEFSDIFSYVPQIISDEDAKQLLTFRRLFNTLAITTSFGLAKSNLIEEFQQKFIFKEFDNLLQYLRYITLELAFGGLTMTRTPDEILFGYKDDRVDWVGQNDPAGGGDPSKPSWIRLGDPNMTLDDAKLFPQIMKTGSDEIHDTRCFVSLSSYENAMFNNTVFDGNKSYQEWQNPWQVEESVSKATDGIINSPFRSSSSNLNIYVPQIYRSLQFLPSKGKDIFELSTTRYDKDVQQIPKSYGEYFNRWAGTHNLTKPYNAPVIVTQPHFIDSDTEIQNLVEFVDQQNNKVVGNKWDKSYQNVEPYTGVPLEAVIQLMITLEVEKDDLFQNYPYALLPVLTLWNSGNFTQDAANVQFGELIQGLKIKKIAQICFIVFGCILVLLGLIIITRFILMNRKVLQDGVPRAVNYSDFSISTKLQTNNNTKIPIEEF